MRILTISKPYVCSPYRKKLNILADDPELEIGLITPEFWGAQPYEKPDEETAAKIWIRSLPTYFSNKNHFHLYKKLLSAVEEFKPDILNVEEEDYSFVTYQCFRIAKKVGAIPTFFAWQNIYKDYPPPFVNIEKYIYKHAAGAMGGSDTAGEVLRRKGYSGVFKTIPQIGINTEKLEISGDTDAVKADFKRQIGVDPEKTMLFYAGRIVFEKGVQTLLEAANNLKDRDIQVVIVGSGPYQEELKKQAAALLPEGMAHFVDHVTAENIHKYIKAADIMCLCSLSRPNWMEQGPVRIITESMTAQTNVIVSDSKELPPVVADAGLVFKEGDAQELTEKILAFLDDEELRKSCRINGLARVYNHYSAKAVAEKCSQFFKYDIHK